MNPSLLLIPDRYKASKLYSQIPDSGAGDLAFTRALDTATRVNSEGLIEKVRTNLATYSNDFSNPAWSKVNTTVTAGQADPFGGTSALRLLNTSAGGFVLQSGITITGSLMTASVWVKSNTPSTQTMLITANSNSEQSPAISVTTSWQRVSWSFTSSGNSNILFAYNASTALDILAYGFQLEVGDVMTDYIPTTTAAVSVGPVANIPRIDYTGGGCGKLLLEPQRTNSVTFSEQFNNAAWSPTRATITANQIISPDGFANADLITDTAFTNNQNFTEQSIAVSNANVTYSIFVKKGSADFVSFGFFDNAFHGFVVNTTTWALTHTFGSASSFQAVNYGNGWYRLSMNKTAATNFIFTSVAVQQNSTGANYNGTSSLSAYFWGAQVEVGSYASSYIPTLGASVTRSADSASKTGISSLIGQTEGTIYVEEQYDASVANNGGVDDTLVALTDGTTNNVILVLHYGVAPAGYSNAVRFFIRTSSVNQVLIDSSALTSGVYKIALAYSNNDVVAYINGVQIGTDTSATIPATSVVTLVDPITANAATKTVNTKSVALYPTRLTNAELATLTSL